MAENAVKSVRKMFRKKRFKRFDESFETHFETDSRLQTIIKNISLRESLWKRFTDDDSDDTTEETNDFLGFDSNSSQRIKELLRRQWQKRLSQVQPKKTILREARLEITGSTLQRIRRSHQTRLSAPSRSGQPGFIVCAICGSQKYYSHVQRRYGVFSCESCSKFFARFLKQPKQLFCVKSGDCPVTVASGESRCSACWLKHCLQRFQIDLEVRQTICEKYSPKLSSQSSVALITVDTKSQKPFRREKSVSNRPNRPLQPLLMVAQTSGPRVKRVCRRSVGGGLPVATFGNQTTNSDDSDELPVDVYLCRAVTQKRGQKSAFK